ncbi:MAG: helicase [Pseudomonadota bacterium]
MLRELDVLDDTASAVVRAALEHLSLTAYGLGYTAMREYLKPLARRLENGNLTLRALWCPLVLPGEPGDSGDARRLNRAAFAQAFGMPALADPALSDKGGAANADFLLWLSGRSRDDYLLVQEYSYDMPPELRDFRQQEAHLEELLGHRRHVDSRSVFAHVAAEVDSERFELSDDLRNHLNALTADNKPLYKLCQASAYAVSVIDALRAARVLVNPCVARALAITPNGLESLAARFDEQPGDTRRALMKQMGIAYRQTKKLPDGDQEGLTEQTEAVFNGVLRKLPSTLQQGMKDLRSMPRPGEDYQFDFEEKVPRFANPTDKFTLAQALEMVDSTPALEEFLGRPAKEALGLAFAKYDRDGQGVSLRDLHAASVVAGMEREAPGKLNVVALEGNPGIGKTTAVRQHLGRKQDGYLFLYVSPRVVINRDVSDSLARQEEQPTGILTVTTNAQLIASAQRWHQEQVRQGLAQSRYIEGAIVADGVRGLVKPDAGSILVIEPEVEQQIEDNFAGSRYWKTTLSENEDRVNEKSLASVLKGMASTTRELLSLNPGVNRVVMTAALQGFRDRGGGKTTMDALSSLFVNPCHRLQAALRERKAFAARFPRIVVMVDELAGDGAGAPFVHAVAKWLRSEFIDCFEGETSPFTVTLVVSDASLGNEIVLDRYLNAGERAPDKVLISRSAGERAFRVALSDVRIGGIKTSTFHVMTNSYPASELRIHYRVRMTTVQPEENRQGTLETPRQAIRREAETTLLDGAVSEVGRALRHGAAQVIYFAQNKLFLSSLQEKLARQGDLGLNADNVQILDSSVTDWHKKQLVRPAVRDRVRVFLMTSSGARGVSFPKTDWIIATVPRFNIEAALMELAQLIYRGRGQYRDKDGMPVSGDNVARQLVMLVDDFIIGNGPVDQRQWLRQSIDLLTLLVMLRSTIWTRITGDAGLRQPLALVPVGAVGTAELVSIMSAHVSNFVREAEIFKARGKNPERVGLARAAQENVIELFARTRLQAVGKKDADTRTMVKQPELAAVMELATSALAPLLRYSETTSIPEHTYFAGPVIVENWEAFAKQEVFVFEGHEAETARSTRKLLGQLYRIDEDQAFPNALRTPAKSLADLLRREGQESGLEFNTLKELKSPRTWIAVPAGYLQFLHAAVAQDGTGFELSDAALWRDALAKSLGTGATMPPIARYRSIPWCASAGIASPLKLELVFDDRYFMASNELNLLNILLLSERTSQHSGR